MAPRTSGLNRKSIKATRIATSASLSFVSCWSFSNRCVEGLVGLEEEEEGGLGGMLIRSNACDRRERETERGGGKWHEEKK